MSFSKQLIGAVFFLSGTSGEEVLAQMSCTDPEQLILDLKHLTVDLTIDPQTIYQRFVARVFEYLRVDDKASVVKEMRNWAQWGEGLPMVATWVKRVLLAHAQDRTSYDLLACFGKAFRGDEVGVLGRDLLLPVLGDSSSVFIRARALDVLESWLEYDEDGMWLEMVHDHLRKETVSTLVARCETLLERYDVEETMFEETMFEEMLKDCPDCGEGHVLFFDDSWYCDDCGIVWNSDPLERDVMEDEDEDEELMEPDPRYEEYHQVRQGCSVKTRSQVPTAQLPDFLDRMLDLSVSMSLGFLESMQVGHLCVQESRLAMYLSSLSHGGCSILRAWDPEGSFALSIEPTASPETWLVFAHRR